MNAGYGRRVQACRLNGRVRAERQQSVRSETEGKRQQHLQRLSKYVASLFHVQDVDQVQVVTARDGL